MTCEWACDINDDWTRKKFRERRAFYFINTHTCMIDILQQTDKSNVHCYYVTFEGFPSPLNRRKMRTNLCTKRNKCCISGIFSILFTWGESPLDDTKVRLMQPIQLQLLQVTGMLPFHQAVGSLSVLTWWQVARWFVTSSLFFIISRHTIHLITCGVCCGMGKWKEKKKRENYYLHLLLLSPCNKFFISTHISSRFLEGKKSTHMG